MNTEAVPSRVEMDVCPICHEPPRDLIHTTCNHAFCRACLQGWIQQNMSTGTEVPCPVCRSIIARPINIPLNLPMLPREFSGMSLDFPVHIDNLTINVNTRTNNFPKSLTNCVFLLVGLGMMTIVQISHLMYSKTR